jgi:8-oxo-dGTP pyrophosphatase MutT (NUDIX family)
MQVQQIRPIVICVFRDGDRMLVAEYRDPWHAGPYYRPLGGGIEFGERIQECIVREIREEIGAEILDLQYLGVVENIYSEGGKPQHQLVFVYEARFPDLRFYQAPAVESRVEEFAVALWKPIDEFRTGAAQIYPPGLFELLDKPNERRNP